MIQLFSDFLPAIPSAAASVIAVLSKYRASRRLSPKKIKSEY